MVTSENGDVNGSAVVLSGLAVTAQPLLQLLSDQHVATPTTYTTQAGRLQIPSLEGRFLHRFLVLTAIQAPP
jgi:hypothetical protein